MKFPHFNRKYIRSIFITVCSAIVLIVMGLSGQQSDIAGLAPEPAFQKSSIPLSSPQKLPPAANNTSQVSTAVKQREDSPSISIQTKFGHFPYAEDEPDRLVNAGRFIRENYERSEVLDLETDRAFQKMIAAASAQGISLMPISGFRSIADQSELFKKQIERRGSEEEAARASAPPGYSEHHTGYALDIADQQSPGTDLKIIFQDTAAYRWLLENAPNYGFEQSFPLNNKQGVNFEPWHWRYFGSSRAAQIFAAARQS